MSEEARAKMYGYDARQRDSPYRPADAIYNPSGMKAESAAIGAVFLAGLWWLTRPKDVPEQDPRPTRKPARGSVAIDSSVGQTNLMAPAATSSSASNVQVGASTSSTAAAVASEGKAASSMAMERSSESAVGRRTIGDEMVRAYWNPFFERWQRIPEGYEAPAAMDLTAWHKKRSDPVEWSNLLATGKLVQIIPRGGLRERFCPVWETHEALLVNDPYTGKTVEVTPKLPARNMKPTCEIQF